MAALVLGIVLLLWLPFEDTHEGNVLLLAIAICIWWAAGSVLRIPIERDPYLLRHLIAGVFAGLAVTPLTLGLMAFKSGLHGHGSPDFTLEQMEVVIRLTPLWMGIGILLALGSGLARKK